MPNFTDSQGKQFVKPDRGPGWTKSMSLAAPDMAAEMRKLVQDSIEDDTFVVLFFFFFITLEPSYS